MGDRGSNWPRKRYGIDMDSVREPLLQKYFRLCGANLMRCRTIVTFWPAFVLLFFVPHLHAERQQPEWTPPQQQPSIEQQDIEALLHRTTAGQVLLWDQLSFPLTIFRDDKSPASRWLELLFKEKVVSRRGDVSRTELAGGGHRIEAVWHYRIGRDADWRMVPEGRQLVYGRPRLKTIVSLSPAYWVNDGWYAEAIIEWYVDDLQHWAKRPEFKRLRLFRRSNESFEKPFTRTINLQFGSNGWVIWRGVPQ